MLLVEKFCLDNYKFSNGDVIIFKYERDFLFICRDIERGEFDED